MKTMILTLPLPLPFPFPLPCDRSQLLSRETAVQVASKHPGKDSNNHGDAMGRSVIRTVDPRLLEDRFIAV